MKALGMAVGNALLGVPHGIQRGVVPSDEAELTHGVALVGELLGGGVCLLYTSPSPRDRTRSRMPSSA